MVKINASLRNVFINITLFFTVLIICFIIGEIGVRLFKSNELAPGLWPDENARFIPELKRDLYPNIHNMTRSTSEFSYSISTNSDGFRDFHSYEKGEDVYRIVGIGASSMFGNTVEVNDTYIAQLGDVLGTETINLGVGGIGFGEMSYILREYGLAYHPDLIIVEAEIGDLYADHQFDVRDSAVSSQSFFLWTYEHSKLVNHLYWKVKTTPLGYKLVSFLGLNKKGQDSNTFDLGFSNHEDTALINHTMSLTTGYLKEMKELADSKGIPMVVIFIPPTFQLNSDKYEQIALEYGLDKSKFDVARAEHFFEDISHELDIPFFDSTSLLLNRSDVKYLDWQFDGHFNAHGNFVYATFLSRFLRDNHLINNNLINGATK